MYKYSMEEELVLKSLKEFVEQEVKPRAQEIDKSNDFPRDLWDRCSELGLIGASVPEEFGGLGMSIVMEQRILEEISKECPMLALVIDAHHLAIRQIRSFGTEAQKKKYLPKMASGEIIGAVASTEAVGCSNYADWAPMATKTEDGLLINTTKVFITNSTFCDIFVFLGIVDGSFCNVLVDANAEGVSRGMADHKVGMNGSGTGTVRCVDVKVPFENVLIPEHYDFEKDTTESSASFLNISAISLGIAESVFEKTKTYLLNRKRSGKPIAGLQVAAHGLADMKCKIEMSRALLYQVAEAMTEKCADRIQIHITKAMIPEMTVEICTRAIRMHGGVGYMEETGIARYLRDALCNTIGEIPTEGHMDQIAILLGLPIDASASISKSADDYVE